MVGSAVGASVIRERRFVSQLEGCCRALGLELAPLHPKLATGTIDGVSVELFEGIAIAASAKDVRIGGGLLSSRVVVRVSRPDIPHDLRALLPGDIENQRAYERLRSSEGLAVLSGPLREELGKLEVLRSVLIEEGSLWASAMLGKPPFAEELASLVKELVALSKFATKPADLAEVLESRLKNAALRSLQPELVAALARSYPENASLRARLEPVILANEIVDLDQAIEGLGALGFANAQDCARQLFRPSTARRAVYCALRDRARAVHGPDAACRLMIYALAAKGDELTLERLSLLFPVGPEALWEPVIRAAESMIQGRLTSRSGGLSLVDSGEAGAMSMREDAGALSQDP